MTACGRGVRRMEHRGEIGDSLILSIIIATRNVAENLHSTLSCIPQQSSFHYQLVIQDGMSSDETCAVAQSFAQLPISIERAPDSGIYDAWNKALARVQGTWTIFIGAGDHLDWAALTRCVTALQQLPGHVEYYTTPVKLVNPSGGVVDLLKPSVTPLRDLPQGMCLPHPGLFHRSTLLAKQKFDAACRIAGDYDFLCRTLRVDNVVWGDTAFASMLAGGVSGSMDSMYRSEIELLRVSRKYFPQVLPYKPLLRLARSGGYLAVRRILGSRIAGYYADLPRLAQGKSRLWSLPDSMEHVALPQLPDIPSIDLLVATLGRVSELDRLLTSLEGQTYKNFRVLLADQNPPGFLDEMLARHPGLSINRIMLPSRGVSIARNILLEKADGDIIVFPDDDCWYAPDTLDRVRESFGRHTSCGALLGVWSSPPDIHVHGVPDGIVGRAGLFLLAGTCVQFFRRETIDGIRFDPLLGPGTDLPYGCGEDTDFLLYVHARTIVRRYRKIRVFHPSPKDALPLAQKVANYAAGRMYLLKKHNFSKLFVLFNVLYPLCLVPADALRYGKAHALYRWRMFRERLRNWYL